MSNLPHWDLTNVFPSLESPEYEAAVADIQRQTAELEVYLSQRAEPLAAGAPPAGVASALGEVVRRLNALAEVVHKVRPYIHSFVSTDSRNTLARRRLSEFERLNVEVEKVINRSQAWIGTLGETLEQAIPLDDAAQSHAFALREQAEQARYLMSQEEEALAAELNVSGGSAWEKLQLTVTSQLSVPFTLNGETRALPMPALINLRTHPDEETRRRAYEAENAAWESVKEPLAAALNGIKGTTVTLNKRRGRTDGLHSAIDAARIDRATLETMLAAMQDSFPMFQRYFQAKAKRLGKEKLAWWDLFAPVGRRDTVYSWPEATAFVVANFKQFSPELAAFAQRAFDHNWIDAEQRSGKSGGGFCMPVLGVRESRILVNFDGSFDQVSTLAHELGHAFHNYCMFELYGKTPLQAITPMTLAETASILCETIITQASLARASDPEEELAILEAILNGDSQVIVDIYSRYLFESELFERRAQAELSASDLCEMMERAQAATYGAALDDRYRQKWMWTWKPHYYDVKRPFYNFPYAFGQLFGTGLYAIYQQRGADFVEDYKALLASTGEANAADLAARFGIDLRSRRFWDESIAIISRRVDRYCELA